MWDIYWGIAVILIASGGVFLGGFRLARRVSKRWNAAVAFVTVLLTSSFALFVYGSLVLARWLSLSNAIVIGNALPLGAAFLAGMVLGQRGIRRWRRVAFSAALAITGVYALIEPLCVSPPQGDDYWTNGVCLQSNDAACSPAAAATLLRHHGIEATEQEMIVLCLTGRKATRQLGLYRGLKKKTIHTPWRVEVFRSNVDRLRREARWPVVLPVKLRRESPQMETGAPGFPGKRLDSAPRQLLLCSENAPFQ